MKKILVVEDSSMVTKVLKHVLSQSDLFEAIYAGNIAEAKQIIATETLYLALVDLNLPDAPNGEIVDFVLEQKLPVIVLTGSFDLERRKKLLAKGVVDYVTKEGRFSYQYTRNLIDRLIKNEQIKVLAVDDSSTGRRAVSTLLKLHRYQVLEASDGVEAIKVILANPDIRMLITDYNMPNMDGFQLVQNLRVKYEKSDLVIIGISGEGEESLTAKFIKNGANDFLKKPFNHEEFFCRVTHNIEQLDLVDRLRDAANRDYYTGAYNRQYFFEYGAVMLQEARSNCVPFAGVVIDFDNLDEINESHGHEAGDIVIRHISSILTHAFDRFLLARGGGEEFYGLLVGLDNEKAVAFTDKLRQVACAPVTLPDGNRASATFSAGVASTCDGDLADLINCAFERLVAAKEAGGDIVLGE